MKKKIRDKEELNFHICDDEDMIENSREIPPDIQEILDSAYETWVNILSQRETIKDRLTDESDDDGPPLEGKIWKYANDIHPETALAETTQRDKPENPPTEISSSNISGISEYSSRKQKRKHKKEKVPERKRPTTTTHSYSLRLPALVLNYKFSNLLNYKSWPSQLRI